MVYQAGTRDYQSTSHGYTGTFAKTSGVSQSRLAQTVAPPAMRSGKVSWAIMLAFAVFGLVLGAGGPQGFAWGLVSKFLLVFSPVIAGCVYHLRTVRRYNDTVFPELYKKWFASWMCRKCGHVHSGMHG
jgi:hypothetical protein